MTEPATIAARTAEAEQQDADITIDRNLRAALDVALMRFNARCELRGLGKWELMPVKSPAKERMIDIQFDENEVGP